MRGAQTDYLICYDIPDPRRLRRLHRRVRKHACMLQHSVYWTRCDSRGFAALRRDIESIAGSPDDDVRVFAIAPIEQAIQWGPGAHGEGILLVAGA